MGGGGGGGGGGRGGGGGGLRLFLHVSNVAASKSDSDVLRGPSHDW